MRLDEIDRRLIGLLRRDARLPVATLAKRLGVSRGTVQNRMERLEAEGVVLGYTARLRSEEEPTGVRAVTLINEEAKFSGAVVKALGEIPEAKAIHTTNGRWDVMVELVAEDLAALDNALSLIRRIKGVTATETIILLTAHKL